MDFVKKRKLHLYKKKQKKNKLLKYKYIEYFQKIT